MEMGPLFRLAVTPARLLWRHWPVLLGLAVAGVVGRAFLVNAAGYLAGVNAALGALVFLLAPLAVLAAVVLMLHTVRSSLPPRDTAPPVLAHLGNVLIPFVGFYLAFGLLAQDDRAYRDGLFDASDLVRVDSARRLFPLLALVGVAFGLHWLLARLRRPQLVVPAAYLEAVWIMLGLLYLVRPAVVSVWTWVQQRTAWHGLVAWWDGARGIPGYRILDGWFVDAFPTGHVTAIFVVPLTGLATACVVLGIRAPGATAPPRQGIRQRRRWAHAGTDGADPLAPRRYVPLVLGLRAMRRTGPVPLMVFCLAVVVLEAALAWLRLAEARLIGPYEPDSLAVAYQPSIDAANTVVALVVLVSLLAAGADLVARHQTAPATAEASPDTGAATPAMPTAPPPQWPLPQPAWAGTDQPLAPPAWPGQPPPAPLPPR